MPAPKTKTVLAASLQRGSALPKSHINDFTQSLSVTGGDKHVGRGEHLLACTEKGQQREQTKRCPEGRKIKVVLQFCTMQSKILSHNTVINSSIHLPLCTRKPGDVCNQTPIAQVQQESCQQSKTCHQSTPLDTKWDTGPRMKLKTCLLLPQSIQDHRLSKWKLKMLC